VAVKLLLWAALSLAALLADPARTEADRAADGARKPAETLALAGVAEGWKVAELFPGGGYYSRLLSRAVGPAGRVTLIPWGEPQTGRSRTLAADPRFANVTVFEESLLAFRPAEPLDLVFTIQNYHDIASPQRAQANQVVFRALKPGGVYLVGDHAARAGSGYRDLPLHRIDEAVVVREVTAAGFVLAGESQALRNGADDRTKNVFDPAIRGRTDQFLLRFVKPPVSPSAAGARP
jgi:predicted methyltransferase